MKRMIMLAALAVASSGCFTSWAITQAAGGQRMFDEKSRSQHLPLPGVREELRVRLPLAEEFEAQTGDPLPFAVRCDTRQLARDEVHHTAFRYGSTWKKVAIIALAIEAGIAASLYFADEGSDTVAGVFAADAIGTAAIALIPRKSVYRREERPVSTAVRSDCPDGLALEINGARHPIDAAGRIGDAAFAELDGWMKTPVGRVRVVLGERAADVAVGNIEMCTWRRGHGAPDPACPNFVPPQGAFATLQVPAGTLTQLAGP
jgi:hypothetical protein